MFLLTLTIIRYVYVATQSGVEKRKLPDKVGIDDVIRVRTVPAEKGGRGGKKQEEQYEEFILKSLVEHKGTQATSGHYIAYIRDSDDKKVWWKFDDDCVTPVGPVEIVTEEAKRRREKAEVSLR